MFGSLGGPELLFLFVLALLLFGPRRLPEIGRLLGKTLSEFRRATYEFRANLEREVEVEALKEAKRTLEEGGRAASGAALETTGEVLGGPVARAAAGSEPAREEGNTAPGTSHDERRSGS